MANQRILQNTWQMVQARELETAVEIVKTVAQLASLEAMQMDFAQGYLFDVPDPGPIWLGKLNPWSLAGLPIRLVLSPSGFRRSAFYCGGAE